MDFTAPHKASLPQEASVKAARVDIMLPPLAACTLVSSQGKPCSSL